MITFRVDGIPVPKQSFRYAKTGGYQPPRLQAWQDAVGWEAKKSMSGKPWICPIKVEIIFTLPDRRKRDIDNLSKAVLDAIKGIVIEDDNQVINLVLWKYTHKDRPGITVSVYPLDDSIGRWK